MLRIKPDPSSGEYGMLDDVEAGIAQSWMILHQLDHQVYLGKNDPKNPPLLQEEWQPQITQEVSGFIFKKTDFASYEPWAKWKEGR